MVCKKCGRSFNDSSTCPFCGVGQENQMNIKKLKNEFKKLKIEENTSSFNSDGTLNKPLTNIEDIIDVLEELKIKDKTQDNEIVPRVNPISDEEIIEVIEDIKENKELFISDKSQYQYIKKVEETDNNVGINDLVKKQKLYYQEDLVPKENVKIELPQVVTNEIYKIDSKNKQKNYKKEIIISTTILIIVSLIIISFIYKFMFSPKAKFIKNISSYYTQIENIIDLYTTNISGLINNDDISLNSTITIKTTENEKTNSEVLNIKYIENKKEKSQYYEYTNYNNIKTEFTKMFLKNNKLYINQENRITEFYSTDARYISLFNADNKDNAEYLFNKLLDSIKDSISDSNISRKKNNELTEYTFTLSEKLLSKIYSEYLNKISEDEKSIQIIRDTFQYSNIEINKIINEKLKELENKTSDKIVLTYKFYINDDNEIIKHSLNYNNLDITISDNENKIELEINKNNQQLLYLKLKSVDTKNNRYNITLNYDNYELLGDYYDENNKIIFNYQKRYNDNENKTEIVNLVLVKGNKEDKKYTNNISIAYQNVDSNKIISKSINISNVLETGTKIPAINISNNVKMMDDNLRNELKEKFSIFIK